MHIVFVTENFPPEGNAAASRVYERARYWVAWGHRVTVITTAPNFPAGRLYDGYTNDWLRREDMDGIEVVRVKSFIAPNKGRVLRILDFLSFLCTGWVAGLLVEPPHVVIATSPQLFAGVCGLGVARARGAPFVLELADLWPASIRAVGAISTEPVLDLLEQLELALYERSTAIIALTPAFERDLVARGVDGDKIRVILNGVDLPRYPPQPRDRVLEGELGLEGRFVVGYIGTHGMAHGLDNVLDAAAMATDDDLVFLLVGGGAERDALVARKEALGLHNVVMVPQQPKESVPRYWSLCDIALVHLRDNPVFRTVIPSKIFEAMAMGLPLIYAGPASEGSAIVVDEGCGVHVPPADPAALLAAIAEVRGGQYGAASLAAAPRHSREHQAREVLDVLEEVGR